MKTWDILVPTFYARTPLYLQLLDQLAAQVRPGIRVIAARDNRTEPIGDKLQRLMEASTADYTSVCADDAKLHPQYVELIHDAMQADPDVIGFVLQLRNHEGPCGPEQVHSIAFRDLAWGTEQACTLGTWMPVRRAIGARVRFHGGDGEDRRWTRGVLATGLLRTEVFIDEVLVMPQVLDGGFHGDWPAVEPTPNPERDFVTYI